MDLSIHFWGVTELYLFQVYLVNNVNLKIQASRRVMILTTPVVYYHHTQMDGKMTTPPTALPQRNTAP